MREDMIADSIATVPVIKTQYTKVVWPDKSSYSSDLAHLETVLKINLAKVDIAQHSKYYSDMISNPGFYSKQVAILSNEVSREADQVEKAIGDIQKSTFELQTEYAEKIGKIEVDLKKLRSLSESDRVIDQVFELKKKILELE